ncbi:DUF1353 domain-containing protein [uncultured Cohaesibacter sp.]|uniref:DUF1353 domain-containing protein n=1 Tax=uncultured Cohaesibacter sp. TaxID=1002546 RepID=UPI0029C74CD1|nr:DUF1353 domain-containing protein [uncultured Cohaesibacter sp.]
MSFNTANGYWAAEGRRTGQRKWPWFLAITATTLLMVVVLWSLVSNETGEGCRAGIRGNRCHLENAPARVARDHVMLPDKPYPYSKLLTPLRFRDSRGTLWTAPLATLTDGASIPEIFVPLIGEPRSLEFLAAAALHDAYCGTGNEQLTQFRSRPWEETHRMLYDSLVSSGVPETKAKVMFAAVYLGGPRWDDPDRVLQGLPESRLRDLMELCIDFIKTEKPTRPEIEAWMHRHEKELLSDTQNPTGKKGVPSRYPL